ncbi:signal peptidase II [Jeotgalibaca caeni]|uniref:signal peptidase II n=1 Tax=Jeotgalibaca caeni TaxID=3028623 RepID=UPI00237EDEAF|nr:signal peptidase II [Jeotgalibaca caeni]MDE1548790.1 signal peptidase II [Jeotgalibaca caeni]
MLLYYIVAAVLIVVDQLTKWGIVQNFELYEEQVLIPGWFSLFYIQNTGAAWGIFAGRMWFFYIITAVVVLYLVYTFHKSKIQHKLAGWSFAFILAGAIGNFIDRLMNGYVVDMFRFDFINFPIFNVADVCLVIGVGLMIIYVLFFEEDETEIKQ